MSNIKKNKQKSLIFNPKSLGIVFVIVAVVFLFCAIGFSFIPISPESLTVVRKGIRVSATDRDVLMFKGIFLGVFTLFTVIFLMIAIIILWRIHLKKEKHTQLKEVGISLLAEVVEIIPTGVMVNNHRLERLICQYPLENGQHYVFKSERLRLNPRPYLKIANQVRVYHERGNPKNYFVDIDGSVGDILEF